MNISHHLPRPPRQQLIDHMQWLALLLLAISIHVLEASMPSLGPWFKPGLANLITLIALLWMGPRAALLIAIWRIVLGSLLIGTLFTPTFIMSMAGGISAAVLMIAAFRLLPCLSVVGISLLGAVAHMLAQFVTVETLFIQQPHIYFMLPPLLLLSAVTGWINGALAGYIAARIRHDP